VRTEATAVTHVLPLDEPARNPLLDQLRAARLAGATTVTVLLSGHGLDIAVGRRRTRPTAGQTPPVDRQDARWQGLLRRYRPLPRYPRISALMARIQRLRDDNARLHAAHLTLVGFGIVAHHDEYLAHTAAIHGEAATISAELRALSAHEAAQLTRDGWTMTLTRHRASARPPAPAEPMPATIAVHTATCLVARRRPPGPGRPPGMQAPAGSSGLDRSNAPRPTTFKKGGRDNACPLWIASRPR
jgi:hypothetical protein